MALAFCNPWHGCHKIREGGRISSKLIFGFFCEKVNITAPDFPRPLSLEKRVNF